jgi:hypothetical protein
MIEYMRDWLETRHLPNNPDLPFSKMMTAYACQTGRKSAVTKDLHCCLSYHLFLPSPDPACPASIVTSHRGSVVQRDHHNGRVDSLERSRIFWVLGKVRTRLTDR